MHNQRIASNLNGLSAKFPTSLRSILKHKFDSLIKRRKSVVIYRDNKKTKENNEYMIYELYS